MDIKEILILRDRLKTTERILNQLLLDTQADIRLIDVEIESASVVAPKGDLSKDLITAIHNAIARRPGMTLSTLGQNMRKFAALTPDEKRVILNKLEDDGWLEMRKVYARKGANPATQLFALKLTDKQKLHLANVEARRGGNDPATQKFDY